MRQRYVYRIVCLPTNEFYYGAKYGEDANPKTFWVSYFTSSETIKDLISEYGKENFSTKIIKLFDTTEEALAYEGKLIKRTFKHKLSLNVKYQLSYKGVTPFITKKIKESKKKIQENGLTNAENSAIKAARTCKYTILENGLSIKHNANIKCSKTKNTIQENGLSNAENSAIKIVIIRKKVNENGLTSYEEGEIKRKITVNKISEDGLTTIERSSIKQSMLKNSKEWRDEIGNAAAAKMSYTRRLKGLSKGSNNTNASKIIILNDNDEMMFECFGTFEQVCKENGLPFHVLSNSIKTKEKIYQNVGTNLSALKKSGNIKFKGWRAMKL